MPLSKLLYVPSHQPTSCFRCFWLLLGFFKKTSSCYATVASRCLVITTSGYSSTCLHQKPMGFCLRPYTYVPGADLGILVGGGVTLSAIPIIYLQHLFSKFHYQLGSPWVGVGGGVKPLNPPPWNRLCVPVTSSRPDTRMSEKLVNSSAGPNNRNLSKEGEKCPDSAAGAAGQSCQWFHP